MSQDSAYRAAYRGAASAIFVHVVLLFAGFTILGVVFDFPDVLRQPAAERLALFVAHQRVVQPTYWLLAMTGFSQIFIAGFLYRALRDRDRAVALFALIFGILCGILQTLGFIRWAILIPYLAQKMAAAGASGPTVETVGLLEGAFNHYAGMAVGEHVANLCLGFWTTLTGVALLRDRLADRRLGWAGAVLGLVAGSLAFEQLGIAPVLFGAVVDYGFPAWAVWLLVLAVSLLRTPPETGVAPRLGWGTAAWAVALYVAMVVPAALGG
jgi:Domain of unknown function (DUF4386)